MSRLVGIDSSTTATSISLFINGKYKDYTLIKIDKNEYPTKWDRLDPMLKEIGNVLDRYKPDIIYQENSYKGNNVDNLKALTNILGGVRFWAIMNESEYYQLMPSQWRKVLSLNEYEADRKVLKQKTIEYIEKKFKIKVPQDDVSDSIAIGLAGTIYHDSIEDA